MNLCIFKLFFQRLIRKIANTLKKNVRFQKLIVDALQELIEVFIVSVLKNRFCLIFVIYHKTLLLLSNKQIAI